MLTSKSHLQPLRVFRLSVAAYIATTLSGCLIALEFSDGTVVVDPATGLVIPDTAAPDPVTAVTHSASNASLTTSPLISWSGGGTDTGGSGFDRYEYSIGTSAGGTQVLGWTSAGALTSATAASLILVSGTTYFANVRVVDGAGNISSVTSSTGWIATGAASQLVFTAAPSGSTQAGTAFPTQPIVEIRDSAGTTVISYSTAITLAAYTDAGCTSASTATLLATTNPLTPSSGLATFAGVSHTKVESLYIRAGSGALPTVCTGPVTITPGPPTKLGFTTQPGGGAAGSIWAQQPVVAVQDTYGNTVPTASDTVTLRVFDFGARFLPSGTHDGATYTLAASTNPLSTTSGVASFTGVSYTSTGITAFISIGLGLQASSSNGYAPATSNQFYISSLAVNKASVLGQAAVIPDLCSSSFTLAIQDTYGNLVDSAISRSFSIQLTGGTGSF